jgi:hypothetical protein
MRARVAAVAGGVALATMLWVAAAAAEHSAPFVKIARGSSPAGVSWRVDGRRAHPGFCTRLRTASGRRTGYATIATDCFPWSLPHPEVAMDCLSAETYVYGVAGARARHVRVTTRGGRKIAGRVSKVDPRLARRQRFFVAVVPGRARIASVRLRGADGRVLETIRMGTSDLCG